MAHQLRVHGAHLLDLVHRGLPDLALRVQAGAHRPLVQQVEQRARLLEAHRERVRQHVERELRRDAAARAGARARPTPPRPPRGRARGRPGSSRDQLGLDHVDARRHAAREQRPRARHHAVSLVLRVGRVRELLAEGVVRVRERAHQRRVRRDVERLEPVGGSSPGRARASSASSSERSRRPSTWRTASATTCGARALQSTSRERAALERLVEGLEQRRRRPTPGGASLRFDHLVRASGGAPTCRRRPGRALHLGHHAPDHVARLVGRVAHARHAPQAVQHDTRDRVDHRRVAGDRDHVARGLDRLLLRLARDALPKATDLRAGSRQSSREIAGASAARAAR